MFQASADAAGEAYEDVHRRFVSKCALGRLSSGDDIAAAVLYLASEQGRNITGQDIVIDAGTIV